MQVESYFSDIGGTLGLYLGMSLMSVVEFFELALDLIIFFVIRCRISMKLKRQLAAGGAGGGPPGRDNVETLGFSTSERCLSNSLRLEQASPKSLDILSLDLELHRLGLKQASLESLPRDPDPELHRPGLEKASLKSLVKCSSLDIMKEKEE